MYHNSFVATFASGNIIYVYFDTLTILNVFKVFNKKFPEKLLT